MQLDGPELEILVRIGNIRAYLNGQASAMEGMTLPRTMQRRREMEREVETLKDRFLNHGLRSAGLPHAIEPATQPLPICEQRHPRKFAGPVSNHY